MALFKKQSEKTVSEQKVKVEFPKFLYDKDGKAHLFKDEKQLEGNKLDLRESPADFEKESLTGKDEGDEGDDGFDPKKMKVSELRELVVRDFDIPEDEAREMSKKEILEFLESEASDIDDEVSKDGD